MLNGYISNLNFVLFKQSRKYHNYTKPVLQKLYFKKTKNIIINIWHDSIKAHMLPLLLRPPVFNCSIILKFLHHRPVPRPPDYSSLGH